MTSWAFSSQLELSQLVQHSTLQLPAPQVNRPVIVSSRARQDGSRCRVSESEILGRFPTLGWDPLAVNFDFAFNALLQAVSEYFYFNIHLK